MTYQEKYYEKYEEYCQGEISREDWQEFCTLFLEELMEENVDVLKRLKEEW